MHSHMLASMRGCIPGGWAKGPRKPSQCALECSHTTYGFKIGYPAQGDAYIKPGWERGGLRMALENGLRTQAPSPITSAPRTVHTGPRMERRGREALVIC